MYGLDQPSRRPIASGAMWLSRFVGLGPAKMKTRARGWLWFLGVGMPPLWKLQLAQPSSAPPKENLDKLIASGAFKPIDLLTLTRGSPSMRYKHTGEEGVGSPPRLLPDGFL